MKKLCVKCAISEKISAQMVKIPKSALNEILRNVIKEYGNVLCIIDISGFHARLPCCHFGAFIVSIIHIGKEGSIIAIPMLASMIDPAVSRI
jgi:hypothetical protein